MEPLDELFEADLVLIIGQFGQFLHRAVRLVSLQDHRVQKLSHNENVVDLFPKAVLLAEVVGDEELVFLRCVLHRDLSLALRSSLVDNKLRMQLFLYLLELAKQKLFLFVVFWLLRFALGEVIHVHGGGIRVPFEVCRFSFAG